ncbi:E3 ubiquitin-protein ligase TRIM45-like [Styela clava]
MMKSRTTRDHSMSRRKEGHAKEIARHSSPILGTVEMPSKSLANEKSVNMSVVNRSSNSSDISMPGQNLHTDSGISSSDSLAGCDKRSPSPDDHDFVSDLMKIADRKLAQIAIREDLTCSDNYLNQSKQMGLQPSTSARSNIVFPLFEDNDMATSSIFMTAMDSDLPMSDNGNQNSCEQTIGSVIQDFGLDHSFDDDIENYDARLYCSACGDILTNPRLLPCLHTFCTNCLQDKTTPSVNKDGLLLEKVVDASCSSEALKCPTCLTNVNLSLEGVYGLPMNHLIQRLLVINDLKNRKAQQLTCDLCPDKTAIEGRCVQCQANLCQFCFQAHKRQSLTAAHSVISSKEIDGKDTRYRSKKRGVPIMCNRHTEEELKLYCLDCSQLVCRDCCLGVKHRDHKCEYVNYVIDQKVSEISNHFKSCEPKIKSLHKAISQLEHSEKVINDTADEVSGKVERHITSYIKSLEKHKNSLLKSIKQMAKAKRESVQVQKEHLSSLLKDVTHSCDFTSQLLGIGTDHEIVSLRPFVIERLQSLSSIKFSENPCPVENFMEFRANKKVKTWIEGDNVSCLAENKRSSKLLRPGLEVDICGDVVSRALEPKYCTAYGEGIHCSRVKLPSEFIVIANNYEREKLENGGHDVSVSVTMDGVDQKLFKKPKVQITDRHDGTYRILYVVYATGNYNLDVQVFGEHIHGSPFHVSAIDSKTHVHSGIFHCCCFCSSGGDKNIVCACGAQMPGGFKGCGHGHEGHPGSSHWSCCGKTIEASSCSKHSIKTSLQDLSSESENNILPPPMLQNLDHRSYTLPVRKNIAKDFMSHPNGEEDMYATPGTLRLQRGPSYPRFNFSRQQSAPVSSSTKQVKTVTL